MKLWSTEYILNCYGSLSSSRYSLYLAKTILNLQVVEIFAVLGVRPLSYVGKNKDSKSGPAYICNRDVQLAHLMEIFLGKLIRPFPDRKCCSPRGGNLRIIRSQSRRVGSMRLSITLEERSWRIVKTQNARE